MAKVAWIGLGVIGYPMAGHLLAKGGHDVTVYNRNAAKAQAWVAKHGGRIADTPDKAALDAEFVFCCVGNDDDLREVTTGKNGAFHGMRAGAVFVDHTTASAQVARELNATGSARGIAFLDAPVSGGQAGAENGVLTVMAGGDEEPFERAKPLISSYARAVNRIGPAGAGQLTKMVNQILLANTVQGVAEAVAFAQATGLDTTQLFEVLAQGAAWSRPMETRWQPMVQGRFDFGFAVDWMRKDLGICLETARASGTPLPTTALIDQLYGLVQRAGGGRSDMASLIEVLRKRG